MQTVTCIAHSVTLEDSDMHISFITYAIHIKWRFCFPSLAHMFPVSHWIQPQSLFVAWRPKQQLSKNHHQVFGASSPFNDTDWCEIVLQPKHAISSFK